MQTPKDRARPGDGGLIKPPVVVNSASGDALSFSTSCKIDTHLATVIWSTGQSAFDAYEASIKNRATFG
jgi:hypothetical protein